METPKSGKIVHSNETRLLILELANMISVPMAINAVVHLKVPDSMWQNGSNTPLTASEILTRIVPAGTADAQNLQRILRMLTSYGVFNEHISSGERRYSLTDLGKTLVTDEDGLSYGAYFLQHHQDPLMKAFPLVHEAVLDSSTEPFVKVNGMPAYEMYGKYPEMNDLMQRAMSGVSVPFMNAILETYDGFDGVKRLVDVGGNSGESLRMILEKHPYIEEAINFDLPEVVARAPEIPGVTHVGGNFLEWVPEGDTLFMKVVKLGYISANKAYINWLSGMQPWPFNMKWILVIWTDDEVKIILNNCLKAIPDGGKLIICEPVLPHDTDNTPRTRALLGADIFVMNNYGAKGYHRTEKEYHELAKLAGFTSFRPLYLDYYFTIIEYRK